MHINNDSYVKSISSCFSVLKDMWINDNNTIPSVWFCCLLETYLEKSPEDYQKMN